VNCYSQATNQIVVTGYPPTRREVPLTLDQAIHTALEHNLEFQIERLNPLIVAYDLQSLYGGYYDPKLSFQAQRQDVTREGGGFNPVTGAPTPASQSQVDSLSGSFSGTLPTGMRYELYNDIGESLNQRPTFNTNTLGFLRSTTNFWTSDAGIKVTQPLLRDFWIDAGRSAIKLRKKDKKIADLRAEGVAQIVVDSIANTYFTLAGKLEAVKVAIADLEVKTRNLSETQQKVKVGFFAPLDEKKAESEVSAARSVLIKAQSDAEDAHVRLKKLMYDDYINHLNEQILPAEPLRLDPVAIDLQSSLRFAMERLTGLQIEREKLAQRDIQLKYDFNQLFPRLDVFASWGVNGLDQHLSGAIDDLDHMRFQQDSYGLQLSFPFTMWKERNNYKASKTQRAQEVLNLKQLEEVVIQDIDNTVRAVRTDYILALNERDTVRYREDDLAAEERKFAVGKSTSFQVLEAASRLAEARKNEIQARLNYNTDVNHLAFVEGRILESHGIVYDKIKDQPLKPEEPKK